MSEMRATRPLWFRDPGFWLLAALVLAHFLFLTRQLIVPDLILHYPFLGGDSLDWISTGLAYAGEDVRSTSRPPLLPVIVAGLSELSALPWLPVLIQALAHLTLLGLFRLLCLDYAPSLAGIISAAWLLNGSWQRLSLDIMADVPAACLLTWAVIFWRRSGNPRPGYALAGLFAGLSAITQQLALLFPAAVLLTLLCFRRRDLTARSFLSGVFLFATPTALWMLLQGPAMSAAGDDLSHWGLLRFHTDSIGHYLYQYIAFVGWPAAIGISFGILSFLSRARSEPWCLFVLSIQAVSSAFFVLLYDFNSLRFLAYVFPLSAVLLAEGLSRLRHPRAALGFAIAAILWALPFPSELASRSRILLWPSPLTYLKADSTAHPSGWRRLSPLDIELETHPTAKLLRHNIYSLVSRRRPDEFEPRTLFPENFQDDQWALYYYTPPETADGYRDVTLKLGNLLRRRVHYLPISALGPLRQSLQLTRLGTLDDQALYRARLDGRDASWIVAVRAQSAADSELGEASHPPNGNTSSLTQAEAVARQIGPRPTAIFASSEGLEAWQAYLPLVVDTSLFFVIEPDRAPGARRLLGARGQEIRIGDAVLVEVEAFGTSWIVIEK